MPDEAPKKNGLMRYFWVGFAILCLIGGLLTVWTPIPTGIPLLAVGIVLLIRESQFMRGWVKKQRQKHGRVDGFMRKCETHLPDKLAAILRTTNPDE